MYTNQSSMHTTSFLPANLSRITGGAFASELTESEEIAQLIGAVNSDADIEVRGDGSIVMAGDTLNGSVNTTEVSKGTFAAVEQWHKKNPMLFRAEVALMRKRFPDAKYRILDSGNMIWIVTLNISKTGFCKPWTFMLRYDPDHPNNNNYGGSIKVMLVNPDLDELRRRASAAGRPGIPHILHGTTVDGKGFIYLCTRRVEDVHDGRTATTTAAQVTAWAADWALHFETGLRDKTVWNNWCNDRHFRHLMIP